MNLRNIAKKSIYFVITMWILISMVLFYLSFRSGNFSLFHPLAVLGIVLLFFAVFIFYLVVNSHKSWTKPILVLVAILSWVMSVLVILFEGDIDMVGILFFNIPMSIIAYAAYK